MANTVVLERQGNIAWLKMNRPEALNAFNREMATEMQQRVSELKHDSAIAAVILTGVGRSFSTGVDLKALGSKGLGIDWFRDWQRIIAALEQLEVPLVIAVNGHCLGGGLMLLLTGDYRIAAADMTAGLSAVKHGIIPGSAVYRLANAVGTLAARRLCLFAEYVDSNEALRLGLVDKVVAPEMLSEAALEVAVRVAGFSRVAVRETKQLLERAATLNLDDFERLYLEAQQRCLSSGEIKPWQAGD